MRKRPAYGGSGQGHYNSRLIQSGPVIKIRDCLISNLTYRKIGLSSVGFELTTVLHDPILQKANQFILCGFPILEIHCGSYIPRFGVVGSWCASISVQDRSSIWIAIPMFLEANSPSDPTNVWFALYVSLRQENVVTSLLRTKGYEAFSPCYVRRRKWCDRIQERDTPLFPGYVFGRFDPRFRLPVLTTPGVRSIVGYGRVPVPISEREIRAIQDAVNSPFKFEPCA